jgi:hypothetical protein
MTLPWREPGLTEQGIWIFGHIVSGHLDCDATFLVLYGAKTANSRDKILLDTSLDWW